MTRPAATMRAVWVVLALVFLAAAPAAAQDRLAITPVTVVDVTDGSLHINQTVIVEGNRITAVGPADELAMPEGAGVVDGAGGYLIPGLWDMHVHSAANVDWHFPLFLAHGVTGVRNLHTTVDTPLALARDIQRRLRSGELLGPRFLANGPIIDGEAVISGSVIARTAADGRAAVDSLLDGGADFIKVYDSLTREAYFAIVDQARLRGVRVAGHVPYRIRPEEAARAGQGTDEHMSGPLLAALLMPTRYVPSIRSWKSKSFPSGSASWLDLS